MNRIKVEDLDKKLVEKYDVYGTYDNDKLSTFHIVRKDSHLGIFKENDLNIKSDIK